MGRSIRRATVVDIGVRVQNLCVISVFDVLHAAATVQFLSDHLVCLDELVDLSGQLVVLG